MKRTFLLLILFFITKIGISADISSTVTGGNWSNVSTWVGGVVPVAGDNVVIVNGSNVIIDQDVTLNNLTIDGTFIIGNNATPRIISINGTTSISASGSFSVANYDITHTVTFLGSITNNGSFNLYNSSSQSADAILNATLTIDGTNSPVFGKLTFNSGTITANLGLIVRGALVIENGATFASGTFTHLVYGNFSRNGTGQMTGNSTITMNSTQIQSITTTATFYNLTFAGGGTGVMGANLVVTNDFLVSNNTKVQTSQNHTFQRNFTIENGSIYEASAGRATFNSSTQTQNINVGTTNSISNTTFNELYIDNGTPSFPKSINGGMIVNSTFYLYNDATVNDNNSTHKFNGSLFVNGICNFGGMLILNGGTLYDNQDYDFNLGNAEILIKGYVYIANNTTFRPQNNISVVLNDDGGHTGLVINDNAQIIGNGSNTLKISNNTSLYIRGVNNFPTNFGTINLEELSLVRYDAGLSDQTVDNSVIYGSLYLASGTRKNLAGNVTVRRHLYVYYSTDFRLGNYDLTIGGNIYNSDEVSGNGSITATGGTVTLNGTDVDQYIYNCGTGKYTFNNLSLISTNPTISTSKYFYNIDAGNEIIVNGNFSASNTNGNSTTMLFVDINDNLINGGNSFNLGAYVTLLTSGTNTFQSTMTSFTGTKTFDVNSTVRFDRTTNGSFQNIPGGFIYGNIELSGDNEKIPQSNLDVNGNFSIINNVPILKSNSNQINVAGNWNMSQATTNLTGTCNVVFDGNDQTISASNFAFVTFNNGGTKTINGTLDILKNLIIQNNVIVTTSSSIYIDGNWQENGTGKFYQNGGTVYFDGISSVAQTIQTNAESYFNNLNINRTGVNKTVTLNTGITIKRTFDFTENSAVFNMNGKNMRIGGDFNFRRGCTFTHGNGKVFFNGNDVAQLIRNFSTGIVVFRDVEFVGTAVKRLYDNSFKFEGSVYINNTTVDGQSWNHYVEGDWINQGIFRHSATIYFNGARNQNISQSNFYSVRFGGGNYIKTLSGNITCSGDVIIENATLDVSPANFSITLDNNWKNDSTGSFIARQGTVTINGEYSYIYTGQGNQQYGTGTFLSNHTGTKSFYNITVNKNSNTYWLIIRGNLTVQNNFIINRGDIRQSHDPSNFGINNLYIGGDFICKGVFQDNNYGNAFIELNATTGEHIFEPGSTNTYSIINFNTAADVRFTLKSNLTFYNNRALTITNAYFDLNSNKITTNGTTGHLTINNGSIEIDSAAILSIGGSSTITNNGGIFRIVGAASNPATLVATNGNFSFIQSSGTIFASNYRIVNTSGNGINIQGGSVDATHNFKNGSFSSGIGTAYITINGIDLGGDIDIPNVTFNSGPTYNVQRTSGNGTMNFINAIGTLAGENFDNDNGNPGTLINWTYPNAVYWDGNSDGDGDNIHWNDPLNWSSNTVPDANTAVILDHSAVSSPYSVYINTTSNANCKSLILTSGSNSISLILDGYKLKIAGDITVSSNSVLTQTQSTDSIFVGGSWANQGTFNEGTSTVVFNPIDGTRTITTLGATDPFNNFIIKGINGGTNVINSRLDIKGDVKLISGNLNAGANLITVQGNWTKNSSFIFNPATSTVNLNKEGDQTISGGEFYNLTISGSGTKSILSNIDINNDVYISSGTVLYANSNTIYLGNDWTNLAGATGFVQNGTGTVVFDGSVWAQNVGLGASLPTTFNNIIINCNGSVSFDKNTTINGDLTIQNGYVYIQNAIDITGSGVSNSFSMTGGRLYLSGHSSDNSNNFPKLFENININGGTVYYYANFNQTIYPTSYYGLAIGRNNAGNLTTKILSDDITIKGSLSVADVETLLDVNDKTINLVGEIIFPTNGRQIQWGINGTLNHIGTSWTVDGDIDYFNNIIKRNTGYIRFLYKSIEIKGNMSIIEDAYLIQDTVNIISTGTSKTFSLGPTAYLYSYNPSVLGSSNGRKAFPVNFTYYNLHKDSRVYISGTIGNQTIYTKPNYGNMYLSTNAEINMTLDGNLDIEGNLTMTSYPTLVDGGFNINIAGATIDIRKYTPSPTTTMTFDGADQRIYNAKEGTTVFNLRNVVFAGIGTKSLYYDGDDYYVVSGNLTINPDVTVYVPRRLDFSGPNWTNNGIFNNTAYVINFTSSSAQQIDPGQNNDFYAVSFTNPGVKTFTNNGINVNNGTFTIGTGTNVDMNNLTHYIASERITNNGGNWITSNANFVFDRNGTQYIPAITCQNITFRRYDVHERNRILEGNININDLNIEEGINMLCSTSDDVSTPTYNVTMTGNFNNNGTLYARRNTFAFESYDSDSKFIKQGQGSFDNVTFNQTILGQNPRTYILTEETRFYENLTIGAFATLKLNGQILRLGNDDPNDPVEPAAEQHLIQQDGILDVDAGASLIFSCRDNGNATLNVDGSLKLVGTSGNNANVTSTDFYTDTRRIQININAGGTISAQYYLIKYLTGNGLYIDKDAIIDPSNNLSNGTWTDLPTGGGRYIYCNANTSGIGTINNVSFNYAANPVVGTHFNVKRDATCSTILAFGGNSSGLLAGSLYEADPTGENNTASSKITWPPMTDIYWTGNENTDWFNSNNWSPNQVPTSTTNAIIPNRTNNPVINGQNAECKDLKITNGYLTLQDGFDVNVYGDVYVGIGTSVAILAVENPNCDINVFGNWTRGQNGLFVHGNGSVNFNATAGSISIDPKSSPFGSISFNGDATFIFNRYETYIDKNFTINNATFQSIANNYVLHIKGNYSNNNGIFDNTVPGTVIFDGSNDQNITFADFWNVKILGSGTKTFTDSCKINGYLTIESATMLANCNTYLYSDVNIKSTATFNDGNNNHFFYGYRWTGSGDYIGDGTVYFDRDNTQFLAASKFNNVVVRNLGILYFEGDVDVTGNFSIIEPNASVQLRTYQLTQTINSGTFTLNPLRSIIVGGVNNFPKGFNFYNIADNSYTYYSGVVEQTIASIPVVYGNLYLDNSNKIAAGHLDINGNLYFYNDASLDITANNYRINIQGNWYNQNGATFNARQGEVVFDGNNTSNLYITNISTDKNQFYNLTINKGAGQLNSTNTNITVLNNLRVMNGILYNSQTMFVGNELTAVSGTFATTGTYYLNKVSGNSNLQLNGSILYNLTINAGATYILKDSLQMNGQLNIMAGTLDASNKLVRLGDYGEVHEISGIFKLGAGGVLQLPQYSTFKVNSGGEVWIVGDAYNVSTVTQYNGRYYFVVENGGTIRARNYLFEFMADNGIYIKDGAIIHDDFNFSFGTFSNSANGGACLRIENNQEFSVANQKPIVEVAFPFNPGGGSANVVKTSASSGLIEFKDFSGELAGEDFDNDPLNLINWISPAYIYWTGNIDNDWFKPGNWRVNFGPARIPLISDNVIITKRLNQPVISNPKAVAKTIYIDNDATLTLRSNTPLDTALIVQFDVTIKGSLSMTSGNDTLVLGGNWYNSGSFSAGLGTVIFNSKFGIKTIDNRYDNFYNLRINTLSEIQIARSLTIDNNFIIINGKFDLATDTRVLTVKGNFDNFGEFTTRNSKLVLSGSLPVQNFNPRDASIYNLEICPNNSTSISLNSELSVKHNLNIYSGIFNLNGNILNLGDASGTDILTIEGGKLLIDANAYLKPANTSSVEINNIGTISFLGQNVDRPAYLRCQTTNGLFNFNINTGGTIEANYYNFSNLNINGIRIKQGANVSTIYNFSNGLFVNGANTGQYLWFENDLGVDTLKITNVYFHNGASYNVKRLTGNGIVQFIDALGLLSGYTFELDNPSNGATSGRIVWKYSHHEFVWTGNINTDWNIAGNWDCPLSVDPSGHAIPNSNVIARIPNVATTSGNFPILGVNAGDNDGNCYDLIIHSDAKLTINNNKNLDIDNSIAIQTNGKLIVANGSASQINVGDIWAVAGQFTHGYSSNVVFDAPGGKLLTIPGNSSFYSLTINSTGNAEYLSGGNLIIENNFSIINGTFSVMNPKDTIFVRNDFVNSGIFNNGNAIVYLNGLNQNISFTGTGSFYKLNCFGSQNKNLLTDIVIDKDLFIANNVTLNGNSHNIKINGNWINRGNFNPASSTITLSGNSSQIIDNYNPEEFFNLIVNNQSANFPQIDLYTSLYISGNSLQLLKGIIESSSDQMFSIGQNVSLVGGYNEQSYISGPVTKIGNTDFVFPIGDGLKFAPLAISGIATNNTFVAQYFEQPYSDIANIAADLDHVSGYEHWTLFRNVGTDNPIVTFYWQDGAASGIDNLATLTTALYQGGQWINTGNAQTTGTIFSGTITSNIPFTTFGACGFGAITPNDNPLQCYTKWTGLISTAWENPNNWTLGVPSNTLNALIPAISSNQPIINNHATVRKLTIDQGATLIINPLQSLTTLDKLYIYGSLILESNATGNASLINNSPITYGSFCKVITKLYLTSYKYHHISSPTTNTSANVFKVAPFVPYINHNFYSYNEAGTTWNLLNEDWIEASGPMNPMTGYTFYGDKNVTAIIDRDSCGNFNTGNKSRTLYYTGASEDSVIYRGWNFVGNPYPANIDWNAPGWTKDNIYNSVYFWNGNNYSYYVAGDTPQDNGIGTNNGTNIIPPMQGFMVKVKENIADTNANTTGLLTIPESARTTASHAFWKNEPLQPLDIIRLKVTRNSKTDETVVRFNSKATPLFDDKFDAFKLFPGYWYDVPQIYSFTADNKQAAINSFDAIDPQMVIRLGFKAETAGNYTISVNEFALSQYQQPLFVDKVTKDTLHLENLTYSFYSQAGTFTNRFEIRFLHQTMPTEVKQVLSNQPEVSIYSNQNFICLYSNVSDAIIGDLVIYNSVGQHIASISNNTHSYVKIPVSFTNGIYIIKLKTKYGYYTQKITYVN